MKTPRLVFVVGAPRSGTTLLRVLLGSHKAIYALPETPWITGAYGHISNLKGLFDDLIHHKLGLLNNSAQVKQDDIILSMTTFLTSLVSPAAKRTKSSHVVFKTPDDSIHSAFLKAAFKGAYFVHIRRDPRDVTLSTMRRFDSINNYGRSTAESCLQRWFDYEKAINNELTPLTEYIYVEYVDLAQDTEQTLMKICEHINIDFDLSMLSFSQKRHDFPDWEEGSRDVREKGEISYSSHFKDINNVPLEARIVFNQQRKAIIEAGYEDFLYPLQ